MKTLPAFKPSTLRRAPLVLALCACLLTAAPEANPGLRAAAPKACALAPVLSAAPRVSRTSRAAEKTAPAQTPSARVRSVLAAVYRQHADEIGATGFSSLFNKLTPNHLFRLYLVVNALDIAYGRLDPKARDEAIAAALYGMYQPYIKYDLPTDILFERRARTLQPVRSLWWKMPLGEAALARFLNEYQAPASGAPHEVAVVLPTGLMDGVRDWMHAIELARGIRERFSPAQTRVRLILPVPTLTLRELPPDKRPRLSPGYWKRVEEESSPVSIPLYPANPARWEAAGLLRANADGSFELTDRFASLMALFNAASDQAASREPAEKPAALMAAALVQAGVADAQVFDDWDLTILNGFRRLIPKALKFHETRLQLIAGAMAQVPGDIEVVPVPGGKFNEIGVAVDDPTLAGLQADWIVSASVPHRDYDRIATEATPEAVISVSEYDSTTEPVTMDASLRNGFLHLIQEVPGGLGRSFGINFPAHLAREARAFRRTLPAVLDEEAYFLPRLEWLERQTNLRARKALRLLLQNRPWAVCGARDETGTADFIARLHQTDPGSIVFLAFETPGVRLPEDAVVCDGLQALVALNPRKAAGRMIVVELPYLPPAAFDRLRCLSEHLLVRPDQTMAEGLVLASVFGDKRLSFSISSQKQPFFKDWLADLPEPLREAVSTSRVRAPQKSGNTWDEEEDETYETFVPAYTPALIDALRQSAQRQMNDDDLVDHVVELARRTQGMQRFFQQMLDRERDAFEAAA